ncbi:metal ABC transporter substrate-binding protein [Patescibacteria group bacterium]|nr:metal ABC transporter substrate-binding protein [Patescibacteria group bacterium]
MKKWVIGSLIFFSVFTIVAVVVFLRLNSPKSVFESGEKVTATIFPLYNIVKNIAGEEVETALLLKPGSSPHTFDPAPEEVKKAMGSLAIFTIGHGLDNWSLKVAESAEIKQTIIVDKNIKLLSSEEEVEEDHHREIETEEERHDHQHGSVDPHYWLSVPNALLIAEQVKVELSILFPEKTDEFEKNFLIYSQKLDTLEKEISQQLSSLKNRDIATFHSAWNYFARDHGINIITTFEEFPGEKASASYLAEFQEKVRLNNVKVIFTEPQFSPEPLRPIAQDLNVKISVLDPLGGLENRETYEALMLYNVNQIVNALK